MSREKAPNRKAEEPGRTPSARAHAQGWDKMQFALERTLHIPPDAPPRLLHDIAMYSAFVEMQSKMTGHASWYQNLA